MDHFCYSYGIYIKVANDFGKLMALSDAADIQQGERAITAWEKEPRSLYVLVG